MPLGSLLKAAPNNKSLPNLSAVLPQVCSPVAKLKKLFGAPASANVPPPVIMVFNKGLAIFFAKDEATPPAPIKEGSVPIISPIPPKILSLVAFPVDITGILLADKLNFFNIGSTTDVSEFNKP